MFRRTPKVEPAPEPVARTSVLDRLDRSSRPVLAAAEAQAQADGSAEIEGHHLLLALTAVATPVAWSLATKGLDEATLRDVLDRRCGVPHPPSDRRTPLLPVPGAPRVPFSEPAKTVLIAAARVASRRERARIMPSDLALAVLAGETPTVIAALDDLGLDRTTLARALAQA
ncbi:MAG TPA: hypothetical protein VGO60_10030 [Iamia sp.]|jgi:ATP-dependent Clp protease ATP-binding subunit ClpA|nr:hypothetical protein [Iamia sp.]